MQPLLAIAVGNTRTRIGLFTGTDLADAASHPNTDPAPLHRAIRDLLESHHEAPIVMASVNTPVADAVESVLEDSGERVLRINRDIAVPMKHALDDAATLGQDRILCAFGAYARAKQAVIVIDAGTCITVDFVDGQGTFQGGAIAPGLTLMLRSMNEGAAALPSLDAAPPDTARGVFGKDTAHAMRLGAFAACRGMVRQLIDTYADAFGAYPQIVATGGDASVLFKDDELVESIVPDLQLIGILEAVKAAGDDHEEAQG